MEAERKAAFTPVDDSPVSDGDLDKAAAAAVANEEAVEETVETQEEIVEEVEPKENGDGLPVDHKARSDLGRKFSALHRRQDEFGEKLDKLVDALTKGQETQEAFDDDVPMTKAEARAYFQDLRKEEVKNAKNFKRVYQDQYDNTLLDLSGEYDESEVGDIWAELTKLRYDPTEDAEKDALKNFRKAERAFFKKRIAKPQKKDVPLKKDPVTGVVTSQKTVEKQEPDVKLSAAGRSYLDFVAKKDGPEKAKELKKSFA